jgi:DNA processing protein
MISARTSLEQGREVFAIPGSIKNPLTEGPHSLIKDGAMLVDNPQDIIGGLNLQNDEENTAQPQTKIDNILLKHLDYDGVSFDELVIKSGLEASIITGSLLELEMSGVVENVNNSYVLIK